MKKFMLLLLLSGTPAFAMDAQPPLVTAAYRNDLVQVQALLDQKVDINAHNCHGFAALHIAALRGHDDIVNELLRQGADVDVRSMFVTSTPLAMAVKGGHIAAAELLYGYGANINTVDGDGNTLMAIAEVFHKHEMVQWLQEVVRRGGKTKAAQ